MGYGDRFQLAEDGEDVAAYDFDEIMQMIIELQLVAALQDVEE